MLSLFCFWFQGYWEQDDRAWRYFLRKLSSQISVERLIFCKSGTSYSESWAKQCSYCTVIATFSCNKLNCNVICVSTKNGRSNKKCLISTPVNKIFYFIVHLNFTTTTNILMMLLFTYWENVRLTFAQLVLQYASKILVCRHGMRLILASVIVPWKVWLMVASSTWSRGFCVLGKSCEIYAKYSSAKYAGCCLQKSDRGDYLGRIPPNG